jgi:glycosyltransferase involved in cell wall biosynthesis
MTRRSARKRLISFRRAFGQTRWARTATRWRRAQLRIPRPMPPDPAFLPSSPAEGALPAEIRDEKLLADAIAWSRRRGANGCSPAPRQASSERQVSSGGRPFTNVLLISHCDFTGNSALHTYMLASQLHARGYAPVIAVPDDAESVEHMGRPPFAVASYEDAREGRLHFADGRAPDLVHAFTPRERVRKLAAHVVASSGCPYVVHLEDNDLTILSSELEGANIEELEQLPAPVLDRIIRASQMHPLRGQHFLERAAGVSVVIERLLELSPPHAPAVVARPGFDEAILNPTRSRDEVRAELGLRPDDCAVVYTGTVHVANLADMHNFYVALATLRRDGHPIVLVKTGWNAPDAPDLQKLGDGIRNLGWVPRAEMPGLLAAADLLVQPGAPGPFNDYRFPAKVPDFLASGKPVILPRTNIGLSLRDGQEAILLEDGSPAEICRAIRRLRESPQLAAAIGERGRAFALRELRWSMAVDNVERLYREVSASERRSVPTWSLELDPPIKAVALMPEPPDLDQARAARRHGIYGFCFPPGNSAGKASHDFPFCFRIARDADETMELALSDLSNPAYIIVSDAPLVLCDDPATAQRWRDKAEQSVGRRVHFTLMQNTSNGSPAADGFDSLVEPPAGEMRTQLATPLPEAPWFRSIGFPEVRTDGSLYEMWLRKLVLQALGRANAQEPLIFVDPGGASSNMQLRETWLRTTRSALRDGLQQFYASRRLDVRTRLIEDVLRLD